MLYNEIFAIQELDGQGMLIHLKPRTPVIISPHLVDEMRKLQDSVAEQFFTKEREQFFYVVWYLQKRSHSTFCGLDFNYILQCLKTHQERQFEHYINRVFNLIYLNHIGLGLPVINCSIVTCPLSGLSNDFFLLNKICFIHSLKYSTLHKVGQDEALPQCSLDRNLYENNHYFLYRSMHLSEMNQVLNSIEYEIPDQHEIKSLKMQFELLELQTLKRLYDLASKDLRILERKAKKDALLLRGA